MSIEEITDWMAYERSISKDFKEQQSEKDRVAASKEEEAEAIKSLFSNMSM